MKQLICLFLISLLANLSIAQFATIEVDFTDYMDNFERNQFLEASFSFNGVEIIKTDSTFYKIPLNDGLDEGIATFRGDTINFSLKFKEGETYTLRPGCCCAIFDLSPQSGGSRGTATINNMANYSIEAIMAEANFDTIPPHAVSQPNFVYESAMCYFKPSPIFIHDTNTPISDSTIALPNQFKTPIRWFLFLHGEKITVTYHDLAPELILELSGYLTKEELENYK